MKDIMQPKQIIGRGYQLEKLIAQGGSGSVWLAQDVNLDRPIAIKIISHIDFKSMALERFSREARSIAKLNHPSIVQIYDVGKEENTPYIVMEYVDGLNLATLISKGKIRISWGIHVAKQISEALLFAHEQGIIHRDIKPGNILIDSRYDITKITDFGLAKGQDNISTVTAAGTVLGTPAYMAPEQFSNSKEGISTDIYTFGATLYHIFTGKLPYEGTIIERIQKSIQSLPAEPKEVRSDLPDELSDLILNLMSPDPEIRPKNLKKVTGVLEQLSLKYSIPEGETTEERALENRQEKIRENDITQIANATGTGNFFDNTIFPRTQFFQDDSERYSKIQETLKFYRDHLHNEYQSLLKQANLTYKLWIICVSFGFIILFFGIGAMLTGNINEG